MADIKVRRTRTAKGRDWKFIDEARFDPEVHERYGEAPKKPEPKQAKSKTSKT